MTSVLMKQLFTSDTGVDEVAIYYLHWFGFDEVAIYTSNTGVDEEAIYF